MVRMRAVDAAVLILEKEGATQAFGLPGAAINPFYSALKAHGGIGHVLARHVEAASHMAEGYTRAAAGNIGVCVGTSGPAGTDMVTGLYSASADSVPILCITGQAPVAKLHKEDFQAVDIAAIAAPVTKWAVTVLEAAQVPGTFQKAFRLMREGRPGPVLIDLPIDVQLAEIEFDIDTYEPLPVQRPAATRAQAEKVLAMLNAAERPLIVAPRALEKVTPLTQSGAEGLGGFVDGGAEGGFGVGGQAADGEVDAEAGDGGGVGGADGGGDGAYVGAPFAAVDGEASGADGSEFGAQSVRVGDGGVGVAREFGGEEAPDGLRVGVGEHRLAVGGGV
ncbi:hypothetical protein F5544_13980 [Nocardia arthritidis]|uniref:acetolactate synthase n=1 Tax=Nocardia arthritidis TaxID=228602 RepID=A0A6G9YCE6_9NOCA|nr:hypothetical protein F5544_13980 [Nocardia arthritidis]